MTADELRKIVDRFHAALQTACAWACDRSRGPDDRPDCFKSLDHVWRDLNRERALMLAEEQRIQRTKEAETRDDGVAVSPGPPESVRGSATEHNAEAIGKLQAKVARLEGQANSPSLPAIHYYGEVQGHRFIAHTSGHRRLCEYCGQWITLTAVEGECRGSVAAEPDRAVLADGSVPE